MPAVARSDDELTNSSDYDSDEEAALGLAPGTVATASDLAQGTDPDEREPIYDVDALHEKLEDIAWSESAPWEATQVVTSEQPTHVEDADDDLQRELAFYQQGLAAAKVAIERMKVAGVAWKRPTDYYAEMVKSDGHMRKVKDQLMYQQRQIDQAEERRKQREAKRFQKQVQAERLKAKAAEKKKAIGDVTKIRKQRQRSGFVGDVDYDEVIDGLGKGQAPRKGATKGKRVGEKPSPGQKRVYKNAKYGFGGKKRGSKRNDAVSTASMDGYRKPTKDVYVGGKTKFTPGAKGGVGKGKGKGGKAGGARPGKARRAAQRGR